MNLDLSTFLDFFTRLIVICMVTPIHECAHAYAAYKLGDDTASIQGRMTLNPLAHFDPVGTICLLFAGFGWAKPVPVNPNRFDRKISMRGGMAITALAGPLSNLLVAILSMVIYRVFCCFQVVQTAVVDYYTSGGVNTYFVLYYMLQAFIFINLGLAIFNLIPIPPLDGSKVLAMFLPNSAYGQLMRYERYGILVLLALSWLGLGGNFLGDAIYGVYEALFHIFFA